MTEPRPFEHEKAPLEKRRTEILIQIGECVATIDSYFELKNSLKKELVEVNMRLRSDKDSEKRP